MSCSVPTIDLSTGLHTAETVAQIGQACRDWGFFQIVNHGVDAQLRQEFFAAMEDFFALPGASKQALLRSESNFWGYFDRELTRNQVDAKEIYDIDANLHNLADPGTPFPTPWPAEMPGLPDLVRRWLGCCESLSQQLLGAICLSLGESATALAPFFQSRHSSFLRFNYYPSQAARSAGDESSAASVAMADRALGIHPHTDAGALAVLVQDQVPGLQVKKKDTWHTLTPEPEGLIINIGDMMQVWSNDRYAAPLHRVLASGSEPRYSAPYFYNPSYDTVCTPLHTDAEPSRYRPVSWREFRSGRAAGDYADLGEEIQISWFRQPSS